MATIVDSRSYHNHHIYTVNLHGNEINVTVTSVSSVVRKWLYTTLWLRRRNYLRHRRLVVGLGVQWTPGDSYSTEEADTLQLCVGRRCLIFQLAHANRVPNILRKFLLNPRHTFVGFWNHSDRRKLESSDFGLEMFKNPLDLRLHVQNENDSDYSDDDENLARAKVEVIVKKCLGFEVEQRREIAMSGWNDFDLSEDQVAYATVDAYSAFLIGTNIRAWEI